MRAIFGRALPTVMACVMAVVCFGVTRDAGGFDQPWDSGHNTTGFPGSPGSSPPGGNNQGGGGDPVNIFKGNFVYGELDINIPAPGISLRLVRHYNSQDRYSGPFGYGWHFSPFLVLVEVMQGEKTHVILKRGDGIRAEFIDNGDGTFDTVEAGWFYQLERTEGGFSLLERDGSVHLFDDAGRILSTADRNGNLLTYRYDASGRIISIKDAAGREMTMTYGANGKISSVADFAGRTHQYGYDAQGNLTSVTNPVGLVTTYEYDTERRLLNIINNLGEIILNNTYDNLNAVITQAYKAGTVNFTYNTGFTRVNNRRSFNSDVYFNENGNPTRIIDPSGFTTHFTYGDNMVLTKISDADGDTTYSYDNDGNIVGVTDPEGNTITYTYEQTYWQITSVTDPLGNTTIFEYDENGNLTKKTDPLNRETLYEYDSGKLTKVTSPDGTVTSFARSTDGYLTGITDTIGDDTYSATIGYDAVGNMTSLSRPNGATITCEYDALGRLTKVTDNSYSPARVMEYVYGPSGRMKKMIENGLENVFQYAGDRLSSLIFPDGTSVNYTYIASDLISSLNFALGTIAYEFNSTDRVTKVKNPDETEMNFTYANDYLTQMTSNGFDLSFSYEQDRRLKMVTDNSTGESIAFSYDAAGNRIQMVGSEDRTTTYAYDGLNRLVGITDPDGQTTGFSEPVGSRKTVILNEVLYSYNHNENNRLLELISRRGSGESVAGFIFQYPVTQHQAMTIQANKRWSNWVGEDIRDKRGITMMKTPFELLE